MNTPKETRMSRSELDNLTDSRIRSTIKLANDNIPFWHKKIHSIGLNPNDIKNRSELLKAAKKGLRITKEEIMQNLEDLMPSYFPYVSKKEEVWSSGSLGVYKAVRYAFDDWKRISEQGIHILEAMKLQPNDRFLSLMAPEPFTSGVMLRESANEFGLLYLQATPVPTPFLLKTIKRFRPNSIASLGTRMYKLPLEFSEMGVDVKSFGLKSIGIGGEPTKLEKMKRISEEWGVPVHDVYATSEAGIVSFSCDKYAGMHVTETRTFVTIVDPETMEETAPGEEGADLITTLYDADERPLNIVINYSHGDISKLVSMDKCDCGITFKRIGHPYRTDDVISVRGVKLNAREIEPFLARNYEYFTGEYISIERFDETKREPYLETRLEIRKPLPENMLGSIQYDVLMEFLKSNPPSLSVMTPNDIRTIISYKGRLYDGLSIQPTMGKPIRLIRRN